VIKVTILGSGTIAPSSIQPRSCACVLVQHDKKKFLVDAGIGTFRRLADANVTTRDIDALFFTHYHPDHVGDFPAILFAEKWGYIDRRSTELPVYGPLGLQEVYQKFVSLYDERIIGLDFIKLVELNPTQKTIRYVREVDTSLTSVPAPHLGTRSFSFGFGLDGLRIVVSGDTDVSADLSALASGSDLFICECSTPDENKISGHLSPSAISDVLKGCEKPPKKIVLTHLYPWCDGKDIVSGIASSYSGEIIVAEDLMVFDLE
jgi:ribonuclease BN (tRNA processing enzyme)